MQHAYTLEALYLRNMYLFLERCRKSNNVWLRVLMQSDCLYSSLFFEHYNRILLVLLCLLCRLCVCTLWTSCLLQNLEIAT